MTPLTPLQTQKEASDLVEIRRLRKVNLLYAEYKPLWDFYLAAYEGGPDFTNPTEIHKHPREHIDEFRERVLRLHYLNYCEPLVDFFTAFIFAETIQRDGGSNSVFYNEFILDVNKKNEDITAFMQQVSDAKQIFGMVYVLVDSPPVPETAVTKAQQDTLGLRPYWVLVKPSEILDWIVDSFDKYVYVKRIEIVQEFVNGYKLEIERYYEWLNDKIIITEIDITNPSKPILRPPTTIENQLGEIPLVLLRYKRSISNKYMGNSFLRDLALNNKEVMNLTSLLQEFLYRQCFNILAIEADSSIPVASQAEGDVGTANLMQYPKGGTAPAYVVPSSDPAKFIAEERSTIIQQMYKRAAQDTVNELFNGGGSSGFSKSQSFSTTVPKIATRAETLEKAENRLMVLTMKYLNKTWDGKIMYKDRYELTNISDALSQLTTLFQDLQLPSETFAKEEMKRFVHEFDGKLNSDTMAKIYSEIDAMDFPTWQQTMTDIVVGQLPPEENPEPSSPEQAATENAASNASKQKPKNASVKPTRKPSTSAELSKESKKS